MDRYMLFPSGMGQHPNGAYVLYADAQATIAALQARVQELEQWVQDQSTANLETMRHTDEMQSRAMEAEQQLTQRTAELEAVNKHCEIIEERKAEAYKEVEIQLLAKANLQAELERVRGERDHAKKMEAVQKEVADNQTWYVQKLRTLIAALPKVEGAVEVSAGDDGCYILPLWIRCVTKEQADGIAALLQERQKLC